VSLPSGRWETWKVSAARTTCSGPERRPQCASVSRGEHVSKFPIGAMGTFEHERVHFPVRTKDWIPIERRESN
jgi:hypothetical protein